MDYKKRRTALFNDLAADAFLILNREDSDHASLFYLTGFTGEGALLLTRGKATLLTDSRYTEQAGREIDELTDGGVDLIAVTGPYIDGVAALFNEESHKKIAFSAARMSHAAVLKLREAIDGELVSLSDPVAKLRSIKCPEEVGRIREAVYLAEESLTALIGEIEVGMSEQDLALQLEFIMREKGAEKVAFDLIVAAGENSALPHYRPGERLVKEGDLLLFDIGVRLAGYCSDMTRVFVMGQASAQAQEIYDLVLAANKAGIAAVRAGESGMAIDAVARDLIAQGGHKDHFGHGLGHGVGLEVHEQPGLSPRSEATLQPGMVVTVEPGVYLPGFGGVRIEDLVVVTEDGCDPLTTLPKDQLLEVG
ncbi:Xaa-Pro peptidase family protein [Candidatus Bipolaricaulota bacterium]|nr:Xaa-Pro peptidase family protein [Candidatus Bipolaricaulota bacterium]